MAESPESGPAAAAHKEYERLAMVRGRAMKGKGAWYWAYLEPVLVSDPDTGQPKAVKLRCSLCTAVFSASNPSRTASEHFKRRACPNFTGHHAQKRSPPSSSSSPAYQIPLATAEPLALPPPYVVTAGGREDLGALAMLEDSVKRLRSPQASPSPALTRTQSESAAALLADWVFQSGGAVPFAALRHPKFRAFLRQVGLPALLPRDLIGPRLDARYREARQESESRIRDALFFQLASAGWRRGGLVGLSVNLPTGATVFHGAVFAQSKPPAKYVEEVLMEAAAAAGGGAAERCAGVIADCFDGGELRELESRHRWMVNLPCLLESFRALLKDVARDVPVIRGAAAGAAKLARFFNADPQRHQPLRAAPLAAMLEDVASSARALRLGLARAEDPEAAQLAGLAGDEGFWGGVAAALALVRAVEAMVREAAAERPLVGECLPLWDAMRAKLKDWCAEFHVDNAAVEEILESRFRKSYHPAWSAAFILDPLYLAKDAAGKYLPQFRRLSPDQDKDVDRLVTRLVPPQEAPTALMELMTWRAEGLDPLYAQAVQVKQRDSATGKMKVANPQSRRLVWETCLSELSTLGKVAARLIFMHATSVGYTADGSLLRWVAAQGRSRAAMDVAQKLVYVAAQAKLERRDFSGEEDVGEDDDEHLFADDDDDLLAEVFADAPSA
ncbi:uncharacterized protein LOC144716691 [Wolffia australiana]